MGNPETNGKAQHGHPKFGQPFIVGPMPAAQLESMLAKMAGQHGAPTNILGWLESERAAFQERLTTLEQCIAYINSSPDALAFTEALSKLVSFFKA